MRVMRVFSWNIQWGRGADGRVDLERTLAVMVDAAPDIICLQEVARNFEGLAGGDGGDELARIAARFPAHVPVFGAAVDVARKTGGRGQFGNLVLTRVPILQVFRHLLPMPPDPGVPSMQRACVEVVVAAPFGPLRVLTTHLEYYSSRQRFAQASALRTLQQDVAASSMNETRKRQDSNPAFAARPRPVAAVLCGDFNCEPDSPEHAELTRPVPPSEASWQDAWSLIHPTRPHAPTVGLNGADWPDRPYCCDFFWVAGEAGRRVRSLTVDAATAASDHQPLLLELDSD